MSTADAEGRARDHEGRFKHDGRWERLCVCGHSLGIHAAECRDGERPCFAGDSGEPCDCMRFRLSRRRQRAVAEHEPQCDATSGPERCVLMPHDGEHAFEADGPLDDARAMLCRVLEVKR